MNKFDEVLNEVNSYQKLLDAFTVSYNNYLGYNI